MGKRQSVNVSDTRLPAGGGGGQADNQVYDHLELLAAMGLFLLMAGYGFYRLRQRQAEGA